MSFGKTRLSSPGGDSFTSPAELLHALPSCLLSHFRNSVTKHGGWLRGWGGVFARSPCFSWGRCSDALGLLQCLVLYSSWKLFVRGHEFVDVINPQEIHPPPHPRLTHSQRRCSWAMQNEYSCNRLHVGYTKGTSMCTGRRGTQLPWKQTALPPFSRWRWWGYRGLGVMMAGSWDYYLSFCPETTAHAKLRETGDWCSRSPGCWLISAVGAFMKVFSCSFTYLPNSFIFPFPCRISCNAIIVRYRDSKLKYGF